MVVRSTISGLRPMSARARSTRSRVGQRRRRRRRGDGLPALAGAAAQSRKSLERQGHRPHRPDPGNLRPARAHPEGALQVELAHLNYQTSRLVRSWTHLERQRGGFGFLGGPGETQIEADRRGDQERIARIEARARQGQAHAQAAPRQPQARALSDRGAWSATPMPANRRCSTA